MQKKMFQYDIELEEIAEGVLVKQNSEAYVARGWQLTGPVVELVETALRSGLNWMIREEHPRRNSRWPNTRGTVYLAFSPTREQQWSLAIDTFSKSKGDFGFAVFNGKYHEQFVRHDIPFKFEARNKGAGHLVVERQSILPTIRQLADFEHNVLDLGRSNSSHTGFSTEYDIQRQLLERWDETPFSENFEIVQDEFPVDGGLTSRRIDILARGIRREDWLIVEIKRAEAKQVAVFQIEDYLLALGRKDEFAFGQLKGALVAERIPKKVREAAINASVEAYEITWPVNLTRVA